MLATAVLTPVLLVVEFDVHTTDLVVVSFNSRQPFGYMYAEVFGYLDISTMNDDLGLRDSSVHTASTNARGDASYGYGRRALLTVLDGGYRLLGQVEATLVPFGGSG
jgi:hypothetical protein